jgi:hypothetical protein
VFIEKFVYLLVVFCCNHNVLALVVPIQKGNTLGFQESLEVVVPIDVIEICDEEGLFVVNAV